MTIATAVRHDYMEAYPEHAVPMRKADLVIADPPYNIGKPYADDPTGDRMSTASYEFLIGRAVQQAYLMLRPGGVMFWLCPASQMFSFYETIRKSANGGPNGDRDDIGYLLWETPIIWRESFAQQQQKRLTCDYRLWFPIVRPGGKVTFNGDAIREESERQRMGDRRADPRGKVPGRVWDFRRLQGTSKDWQDWHPCQLAPEMLERIILGFSNAGDWVVDAFAGSGSAGAVCIKHGRNFTGFDRSPTYVEKIRERLAACRES